MIPIREAIRIVLQNSPVFDSEAVALADALGRILAEDIVADSDLPPFDRAQMDGYAVRAADVAETPALLRIAGESAAGARIRSAVVVFVLLERVMLTAFVEKTSTSRSRRTSVS